MIRQHTIATGIIVDPDGYIVTNALTSPSGSVTKMSGFRTKLLSRPGRSAKPAMFSRCTLTKHIEGHRIRASKHTDLEYLVSGMEVESHDEVGNAHDWPPSTQYLAFEMESFSNELPVLLKHEHARSKCLRHVLGQALQKLPQRMMT